MKYILIQVLILFQINALAAFSKSLPKLSDHTSEAIFLAMELDQQVIDMNRLIEEYNFESEQLRKQNYDTLSRKYFSNYYKENCIEIHTKRQAVYCNDASKLAGGIFSEEKYPLWHQKIVNLNRRTSKYREKKSCEERSMEAFKQWFLLKSKIENYLARGSSIKAKVLLENFKVNSEVLFLECQLRRKSFFKLIGAQSQKIDSKGVKYYGDLLCQTTKSFKIRSLCELKRDWNLILKSDLIYGLESS